MASLTNHLVLEVDDDVLATEILCNLRYRRHYYMAKGMNAESIKSEFLEHAQQEHGHEPPRGAAGDAVSRRFVSADSCSATKRANGFITSA